MRKTLYKKTKRYRTKKAATKAKRRADSKEDFSQAAARVVREATHQD